MFHGAFHPSAHEKNQGNEPGGWLDFGGRKGSTPDLSHSYGLSVMSVFECGWYQIQAPIHFLNLIFRNGKNDSHEKAEI